MTVYETNLSFLTYASLKQHYFDGLFRTHHVKSLGSPTSAMAKNSTLAGAPKFAADVPS